MNERRVTAHLRRASRGLRRRGGFSRRLGGGEFPDAPLGHRRASAVVPLTHGAVEPAAYDVPWFVVAEDGAGGYVFVSSPESLDELSVEARAVGDVDDDDGAAVVRRAEGVAARGDGDGVDFVVVEGVAVRGTARGRGRGRSGPRWTRARPPPPPRPRPRDRARGRPRARRGWRGGPTPSRRTRSRRTGGVRARARTPRSSPRPRRRSTRRPPRVDAPPASPREGRTPQPRHPRPPPPTSRPRRAARAPSTGANPCPWARFSARSFSIARRAVRRREGAAAELEVGTREDQRVLLDERRSLKVPAATTRNLGRSENEVPFGTAPWPSRCRVTSCGVPPGVNSTRANARARRRRRRPRPPRPRPRARTPGRTLSRPLRRGLPPRPRDVRDS